MLSMWSITHLRSSLDMVMQSSRQASFFSLYVYMLHEPISCSNPLALWNYIVVQPLSLYYHSLPCPPTERNASTFNVHCLTKSIAWSLVDLLTSYLLISLNSVLNQIGYVSFKEYVIAQVMDSLTQAKESRNALHVNRFFSQQMMGWASMTCNLVVDWASQWSRKQGVSEQACKQSENAKSNLLCVQWLMQHLPLGLSHVRQPSG